MSCMGVSGFSLAIGHFYSLMIDGTLGHGLRAMATLVFGLVLVAPIGLDNA
jgi:hypothetical protein